MATNAEFFSLGNESPVREGGGRILLGDNTGSRAPARSVFSVLEFGFQPDFLVYTRHTFWVGRDSSVGVATRDRLDGPGIESRWGRDFLAPTQTGPGAHPAAYTMYTGSLSRG